MTFFLSKFLWYFFNPFNLIIFLVFLSFALNFLRYKKISRFLVFFNFLIFFIVGFIPSGSYLTYLLEKNYHNEVNLPSNLDGILILSGATNPSMSLEHNQISLNGSVERLTESIVLMNKYPNAKIIFSGGSGSINSNNPTHASIAKLFFQNMQQSSKIIFYENESRNTYENILFSKKIADPLPNENWLVITSAFHMKRTISISQKLNWELIPYPVDYRTYKKFYWKPSISFLHNINFFNSAMHEWIGIFSYYLMGRI